MPLILGANSVRGAAVHQIAQSIRFNDDDSPALNKTYSGAGSRVKFTYSCWLKVATTDTGSGFPLFNGGTGTSDTTWSGVAYYQGMIYAQGYNTNWRITTRKLRDPAAWYHIVYVWDTGQVADTERIKIFINGVRETEFSTLNHPAKDAQSGINQAAQHSIGYQSRTVGYGYADAYMTEMVFIDGQALDPSSFAEYNENGIWVPKDVSGLTFGTNGFHIDGRDSADLGDDESGQGNDYTSTGLAAHDQVSDSPTNNFCVMSPIDKTFNSITVDSDTSTSDMVLISATSKVEMKPIEKLSDNRILKFSKMLELIMKELALDIVKDGEGAKKLVEYQIVGATNDKSAKNIAFSIANSPLVKTAVAGEDPNWGRIIMAIGKSGEKIDQEKIKIFFGQYLITKNGKVYSEYDEEKTKNYMKKTELLVKVDLGIGKGSSTIWGCDLTKEYIDINADYRS